MCRLLSPRISAAKSWSTPHPHCLSSPPSSVRQPLSNAHAYHTSGPRRSVRTSLSVNTPSIALATAQRDHHAETLERKDTAMALRSNHLEEANEVRCATTSGSPSSVRVRCYSRPFKDTHVGCSSGPSSNGALRLHQSSAAYDTSTNRQAKCTASLTAPTACQALPAVCAHHRPGHTRMACGQTCLRSPSQRHAPTAGCKPLRSAAWRWQQSAEGWCSWGSIHSRPHLTCAKGVRSGHTT